MTLTHKIDYSEVENFTAVLQQSPEIVAEESHYATGKSLDVLEGNIAAETPVNQGVLRGSIAKQITGHGINLTGEVATPLIYGMAVEKGREPGKMPPVGPIYLWAYRKGIVSRGGKESRAIAWAIARAIGRRGTRGAFMFKKGFERSLPAITRIWNELPGRVTKRLSEK